MKKQEIKADPIRDKIVQSAQYLSDNSLQFWIVVGVIGTLIAGITIYSNNKNRKLADSNLRLGLLQNKAIYDAAVDDSLLLFEFEDVLKSESSSESYNQAYIYVLKSAIKNNDKAKVNTLLNVSKFNSDDDLLNSFVYKVHADYSEDSSKAIRNYQKAVDLVPNYDLKVKYSIDLINLFIDLSRLDDANIAFENIISITKDVVNLPASAKNNIDYIDYRLRQLNK